MPRLTGKHILMEMLKVEGVTCIFGNPGTTETPLMDALQDYRDVRYYLGLQEAVAVGMADGYARATRQPAFVNVHIAGGLANALSMLYDAARGGTPLVVTAGQTHTYMNVQEPALSGNLVEMARQYTKWSVEVNHASNLAEVVRRAFKVARTPPTGPVFISLPWNVMDEEADVEIVASSGGYFRVRPDVEALERAASELSDAERPLMLVGDRVAWSDGVDEAVRLAELMGLRVYAAPQNAELNFPTNHPQYMGPLDLRIAANHAILEQADTILAVGTHIFRSYLDSEIVQHLHPRLLHLDSTPYEIERTFPVAVGVWADPKSGMAELAASLDERLNAYQREAAKTRAASIGEEKRKQVASRREQGQDRWDSVPMPAGRLMKEVADALPPDAIVIDEAVTSRPALQAWMDFEKRSDFHGILGGALGWAMGGALGVQVAEPSRKVVALIGDGSAMYSVQALWTAVRYDIPVTYVICNNRSYKILKNAMDSYLAADGDRTSEYIGMKFNDNPLRYAPIAESFGVMGLEVEDPKDLKAALEKAFLHPGPSLVDVLIAG